MEGGTVRKLEEECGKRCRWGRWSGEGALAAPLGRETGLLEGLGSRLLPVPVERAGLQFGREGRPWRSGALQKEALVLAVQLGRNPQARDTWL